MTCREEFSGYFDKGNELIGWHKRDINLNNINDFFETIEKKIKPKDKIVIFPTEYKDAVVIQVSEFWRQNAARRQLFTLFLRCGSVYYKGDFEGALRAYELTFEIRTLINHFLRRNINPTFNECNGIVQMFKNKTEHEIKTSFTGGANYKPKPVDMLIKNHGIFA